MSDIPPPPPPPPGGGATPPPPPPPSGGGYNPTPPPPPPPGGGYNPPPPPPGGGFVPPPPGPGYGPPGGYVPPPPGMYMPPGAGYAGQRTDGLAIAALVIGIVSIVCSIVCLGIIFGPTAAIMGFISHQRIATSGGMMGGGTLALVGLILGIVGFVASVGWFFYVVASGAFNNATATPTG